MKTHTSDFKNQIKSLGRQLQTTITYGNTTLSNEDIFSLNYNYKGDILKSVMRQVKIDCKTNIPLKTQINIQIGVLINGSYENLNYGTFIVENAEKQENTNSYLLTCYDKMIYSMVEYEYLGITYPITIRNYIGAICTHLGLTFANSSDTFVNYNKKIPSELYLDDNGGNLGYTFRDVLDELAQVTASTICINEDDELEVRYITNTNDTIDEEFFKNVNVKFGEVFGPINTIVLARSAGADKISLSRPIDLADEDKIPIEISDNQILNDDNRDTYMADILGQLYGLTYCVNDYSSTGILYYDLCDRYSVTIDNSTYTCVMLNDEINVTQGLEENIFTEMPETKEEEYKYMDDTDRKINKTTLIVDKQKGTITSVVSRVDKLDTRENNNYQKVMDTFGNYALQDDLLTLETSVETLQTDTYTKTEINTKLTDGSVTKVNTTSGTFDADGMHYEKTDAPTKTTINESGVEVDSSSNNNELLFAGYDGNIKQTIVRTDNINVKRYLVIGNNTRLEDYGNGGGMFIL